jgi:hypothetical protein
MAEEKPYIGSEQRPDLTINLDKNVCDLTLRELREAILETSREGTDDLKLVQESAGKNNTKDKNNKEQNDLKAQQDHKNNVDKQKTDFDGSSSAPGPVLVSDRSVLELLRRLLTSNEG